MHFLSHLNTLHAGTDLFQISFDKTFFQEHHQSIKRFGFKLFSKVINRGQFLKVAAGKEWVKLYLLHLLKIIFMTPNFEGAYCFRFVRPSVCPFKI